MSATGRESGELFSRAACPDCLRRGLLLRALAAHVDRAVDRRVGDRARDLLALADEPLARAVTSNREDASAFLRIAESQSAHRELGAQLERLGLSSICRHSPGWPTESLERLQGAAPRALFLRGERGLLGRIERDAAVTIVGARRAGEYGREVAASLAAELGASGVPVISGLAFGIDTAAHEGALRSGAATLAVLGAGAERPYPRSRGRRYKRICSEGGAAISELPPDSPTFRWTFPARTRIMAALAGLTVVVEAAERSGSLITAEMAGECGRSVGAVPGPVNSWRSSGTNLLLADGARVIRGAADAIEELLGPGAARALAAACGPALDPSLTQALDLFERGARSADDLARAGALSASEAAIALSRLELEGYLSRQIAGGWVRTAQALPPEPTPRASGPPE